MKTGAFALSTLLAFGASACLAQEIATPQIERAESIIRGNLIESYGVVYRALRITPQAEASGPTTFSVLALPIYEAEQEPGPKDRDGRPKYFDLRVESDICMKFPPVTVLASKLRVLVGGAFVHWLDAVKAKDRHDRPRRPFMPPARLGARELARARKCSKHADYGYSNMPMAALEIYSGDQRVGSSYAPQRAMWTQSQLSVCHGPQPITRVVVTPATGFTGRFTVSLRAVSGLQCHWPDRTRETGRDFRHGLSDPVEMTAQGNEFTLADFAPLWKMPAFPEYINAELAAVLEEPVEDAACEPLLRGHRISVSYEGEPIYSYDHYPLPHCLQEYVP